MRTASFPAKIDTARADDRAGCHDRFFTVPTTVRNHSETMAYAGYKHILPAYCENTLKTRFATDPDCAEMLNLIFDNQVISFAYLFSEYISGGGLQSRLIVGTVEQNNVASFLKTKQKIEEKMVKKICQFYEKEPK